MKNVPRKPNPGKNPAPASDKRKKWIAGAILAVVVLLFCGWFLMGGDPQVAKVQQMQEELFSTPRDQMTDEDRKAKWEALKAEEEKLSPDQRRDVRREMGKKFEKKMNASAASYFAM